MQEIARLLMGRSSDLLGEQRDGAGKSISMGEINLRIEGASKDETRVVRAIDRMVSGHALERVGFGWKTTSTSAAYFREVLAS
ncbi:hypothetical protein JXA47_14825 [Candidatus Sumerlaeota bacterium]|nr:hypothetical protein [Candidatus Sumerlaeota bacterium]